MPITVEDDLSTSIEPLPRGPIIDMNTGQFSQFARNWFEGNRRQNGEILSGINHNRAIIVQLETDYTAADGAVTSAYISADAVVAADATSARATLSTTLTTAYQSADTALEGTLQADIDTRATIIYVDSVESSLAGSIATQYSTITAEYTAVTDVIAGDVTTNAADITTEASARASGDSANATSITTLTAEMRGGGNLLLYSRFDDVDSAGNASIDPLGWDGRANNSGMSGATVGVTGSSVGATNQPPGVRCIRFSQPSSVTTGYSDAIYIGRLGDGKEMVAIPGQRYCASVFANSQNTSAILVLLRFLDSSGTFISNGDSQDTTNYITASSLGAGASLANFARIFHFADAPSTARFVALQIYKSPNASGSASFGFATLPMIEQATASQVNPSPWSDIPNAAKVEQISEAYATDSASTARLVWTVATGTNVATIEQTAAEGYSDGTWNGSAISLTASEIILDGDVIVTGTLTTGKLEANAFSEIVADSTDAATSLSNNTWTTVATTSITVPAGADLVVTGSCFHEASYSGAGSGSAAEVDVRIRRDSTVLRTQDATTYVALFGGPGSVASAARGPTIITDVDLSLSAGTYTYTLQANINLTQVGASSITRDISNRLLYVTQLKR